MTTKQNTTTAHTATRHDIAQLIVQGLAGQRSKFNNLEHWSGREYRAVMEAAEALLELYRYELVSPELIARLGRSIKR